MLRLRDYQGILPIRGATLCNRLRLNRDRAHPCHVCTGTGLTPASSAPGLGSPLPPLRRGWAHRCHICTGTGLTPAHMFCAGAGLTAATSAPGRSPPLQHLHGDWARRRHICIGAHRCRTRAGTDRALAGAFDLPGAEDLLDHYTCALQRRILLQGRLYARAGCARDCNAQRCANS